MSQCIEKLPHDCGSHDALQVFLDDKDVYTGYCFACDTYVPDPYGGKPPAKVKRFKKTPEETKAELDEITACPTLDLPDRALRQSSLEYFGVKIGVSEQDGLTPVFHFYPYEKKGEVVGYKTRLIEGKNFYSIGDIKEADLFGWQRAIETGAKALYITEGELDAVALFQALKNKSKGTQYESYNPAVVSLQHGAGSAKRELARLAPKIKANFKDVVLVFDHDEVGEVAVKEAMQSLPHATSVTLPAKDPNDCVIKGVELAMCNAVLFKKEKPKNTRLLWGRELIAEARMETPMGMSWPWEGLTHRTRGIRLGETIYLGSGVKMGKTTMVASLISHFMVEHGMKVFCAQPEETTKQTFKLVAGKVAKRIFHDPTIPFDYDSYDKVAPMVGENLCLLNLYQSLDWDTLRIDIHSAVEAGCQAVFIDPVTNLTNLVDSGEANTILQGFAQELAFMAKDLNIIVFIFCHLKAPLHGPPHERGGMVHSSQFAGSRAMMRSCNLMLGLEGDKDPDKDLTERNMRRLVILEDRAYGATGYVTMYYNDKTGLLTEMKEVA
jgi:twinkle protein